MKIHQEYIWLLVKKSLKYIKQQYKTTVKSNNIN